MYKWGRRCAAESARVGRCVEEGALRRGYAYGCGRVQVRSNVGGVALRRGHGGSRAQALVRSRGAEGCRRALAGSLYSGVLLPLHQVAISGKERI